MNVLPGYDKINNGKDMAKTKDTLLLEQALTERSRKRREYGCTEVTIGFKHDGHGDEIVDYMSMDSQGIFQCYELKVSLEDLRSEAKKSWYGDYNYLVVSERLYARNPAWGNYIPPYVGILSGTELKVRRQAENRSIDEETRKMLEDSLLRSIFWKMDQFRDASDPEKYRKLKKELEEKEEAYELLKKEMEDRSWAADDYQGYYRKNHQVPSFRIEEQAKEERRQYFLRRDGGMTWSHETCPVCGEKALRNADGETVLSDYCPHCGTDLRKI